MLKYFTTFLLGLIFLGQYSCEIKSEEDRYKEIMVIDSPQKRVTKLQKFLSDYPKNNNKERILSKLFQDYVSLQNEENALIYADQYLNFFPKGYRMSQLNSVAWTLAENKIGLDSAKVYADRAVEQAQKTSIRNLNNIKDTQSYVYYQAGDAKKALEIQLEAMQGNEDSYDFLSRLGMYQHAAGEKTNAYETIAKSILLGGGLETEKQLSDWMIQDMPEESERNILAKKVANKLIKEFLNKEVTADKKSRSAYLFAVLKTDLNKSENWAKEALESLTEDSEFARRLDFSMNLASVYMAAAKYDDALRLLQNVKDYASIYDLGYWYKLGNAYSSGGQNENAVDAYINGMLWRKSPVFIDAIQKLGFTTEQINQKIVEQKTELKNFHPGKYKDSEEFEGRIVLTELFTGAECPPCKGADLAMDLIAEYYPRSMVTILEYHLHIPGPDPLTNPDTEARYKFYGKDFGTPTVFFNGSGKIIGGGDELVVRDSFNKYKKSIEKYFTDDPSIKTNMQGKLDNNKIHVNTEVKFKDKIDSKLKLHVAVVEKSVNYTGRNGISKHAFVVRYLMTGSEGEIPEAVNNTFKFSESLNLAEIEGRQSEYLKEFENNPPKRFRNFAGWKETKDKINADNLAIVAWMQNSETKEILQSQYAELK